MRFPQNDFKLIEGDFDERPDPSSLPVGTAFFSVNTNQLFFTRYFGVFKIWSEITAASANNVLTGTVALVNGQATVNFVGNPAVGAHVTVSEALGATLGAVLEADASGNTLTIRSLTTGGVIVATDQSIIFYTIYLLV